MGTVVVLGHGCHLKATSDSTIQYMFCYDKLCIQ